MKVAAICAPSKSHNTGMLSVDLAAMSLFPRTSPHTLKLFNVEEEHTVPSLSGPVLHYEKLSRQSDLNEFDRVIYWGDFLQSRAYHRRNVHKRGEARGHSIEFSEDSIVYPLLLLENAPKEILEKTIFFGNSVYINRLTDEADERYLSAISRVYAESRLVMLRDPISAFYAMRYSGGMRHDSTSGIDPSFLLSPFDDVRWQQSTPLVERTRLGYSFGRGPAKDADSLAKMNAFVRAVADNVGATDIVNLSWLKSRKEDPVQGLLKKLSTINSCRAVVTDTYHCAINALREGIPAICIGDGAESPTSTLSDKKKEILYLMFNIKDLYVFVERLTPDGLPQEARAASRFIMDHDRIAAALRNIRTHADMARSRLLHALQ